MIQVTLHIPHKGFETVTFSFSGSIEHKDAAGNSGVIHSGDVQWMTAASGVLHKEFHEKEYAKRGRLFHALQLWINLPERHKTMHLHINIYLLPQWGGINLLMKQSMPSFTPVLSDI